MDLLLDEIVSDLTEELQNESTFNADILRAKVKSAIREVREKRMYQNVSYSETQINADMQNFYSVIRNVALYDYNMLGAEGETSHDENGTARTYVKRSTLFSDVIPFVKMF